MSKHKKTTLLPPPCSHHRRHELSYSAFFTDAEERHTRGEEQVQCSVCLLWLWPDEIGEKPAAVTETAPKSTVL